MSVFLYKGASLNSSRMHFVLALVCGVMLSACSDVSDVTDPDSRDDIASWFHGEGASSSSQAVSSSSVSSSSTISQSSSSLTEQSSSSSTTIASSSSSQSSSSSSLDGVSSSSSASLPSSSSQVIDSILDNRDNQYYTTVVIGTQTWMAENLAYLPTVNSPNDTSSSKPYQYVSGNSGIDITTAKESLNYKNYGVLYNWTAATKEICPEGWHLPTAVEWQTLVEYAGVNDLAAEKLKANNSLWSGSGAGTDALSFSALPGGYFNGSSFLEEGGNGYWWTATENGSTAAYARVMHHDNKQVTKESRDKGGAYSVRCVKDP